MADIDRFMEEVHDLFGQQRERLDRHFEEEGEMRERLGALQGQMGALTASLERRQGELDARVTVLENDMKEIREALAETATREDIFASEVRILGAIGSARWRASAVLILMGAVAIGFLVSSLGLGALR